MFHYPDSIAGRYPTVSLKDKNGMLWFGCSDGSVFYVKENSLVEVPYSNSKSISDITEGPDGLIYIIPQGNAVFSINPKNPEEINRLSLSINPVMFSASFTQSGNLLIGTQENILVCSLDNDSVSVIAEIEGFDYSSITSIRRTSDSSRFVLGTDGNGLFQLEISDNDYILTRFDDHPEWESLTRSVDFEDSDNYLWVSTFGSGVIQFKYSENYETIESVRLYNDEYWIDQK